MSKKPSTIEIYSLADFKKADRISRIRMHMLEPDRFVLNDQDETYYRQLQQAYQLVFEELRQSVAIKTIQEAVPGAETWHRANTILQDIYELFAPFLKKNKDLRRAILVERLYHMAKVAESKAHGTYKDDEGISHDFADKDWMELAMKLYVEAGRFEGLDEHDTAMIDPDEITIPEIEITSDPTAFLEAQNEEAEEGQGDEWDDE